jgi:hypothetical protein
MGTDGTDRAMTTAPDVTARQRAPVSDLLARFRERVRRLRRDAAPEPTAPPEPASPEDEDRDQPWWTK